MYSSVAFPISTWGRSATWRGVGITIAVRMLSGQGIQRQNILYIPDYQRAKSSGAAFSVVYTTHLAFDDDNGILHEFPQLHGVNHWNLNTLLVLYGLADDTESDGSRIGTKLHIAFCRDSVGHRLQYAYHATTGIFCFAGCIVPHRSHTLLAKQLYGQDTRERNLHKSDHFNDIYHYVVSSPATDVQRADLCGDHSRESNYRPFHIAHKNKND